MWTQEYADFDAEVQRVWEIESKKLKKPILQIFKQAINQAVYMSYTPHWYTRTDKLKNSVKVDFFQNRIYVYVDTSKMKYTSEIDGRNVAEAVPWFVEVGHRARNYTPPASLANNQFHRYFPPRQYLELAQKLIKTNLGIDVEIIKDAPSWV